MLTLPCPSHRQRGAHLLEALIAIAIFSSGILGLVGVLAHSIRATQDARVRTEAAQFAHAMIAEMWTTPTAEVEARFAAGGPALSAWKTRIAGLLPEATATVDFAGPSLSTRSRSAIVTIAWRMPGSAEPHRYVTSAEIGRNP